VPEAHVHTFAASATSSASLSISVGTPIWLHWLRIAKEQTTHARRGANTAPSPLLASDVMTEMTGSVTDEMYPAMMAIAAAAFALDGLYDQVRSLAPPRPAKGRPKRQRLILETLKHAFAIGSYAQSWLAEFDWLNELRDPAVHPEHKTGPAVAHPSGWGNFAVEYTEYSADNAERALALLQEVLRVCVEKPKPASRTWAEGTGKSALAELMPAQT
jgi:hypothetical protein